MNANGDANTFCTCTRMKKREEEKAIECRACAYAVALPAGNLSFFRDRA